MCSRSLISDWFGSARVRSVYFHPNLHRSGAKPHPDCVLWCRTICTEPTADRDGTRSTDRKPRKHAARTGTSGLSCGGLSALRPGTDTERVVAVEPGCGAPLAAAAPACTPADGGANRSHVPGPGEFIFFSISISISIFFSISIIFTLLIFLLWFLFHK